MDFYNQYMVHSLFPRGIIILQGVLTNLVEILMKIDKKYMYVLSGTRRKTDKISLL